MIQDLRKVFLIVWASQVISGLGTGLTEFALGVFVYQRTGSATQFAMVLLFTMVPSMLLSPLAGSLADRWDRRRMMLLSNAASGVVVFVLMLLLHQSWLELWHIYVAVGLMSLCNAFRDPAYHASVSQLVTKEQAGRASGMVQSGDNLGMLGAPVLAGILIVALGLPGVLIIDAISYVIGFGGLVLVAFPPLDRSDEGPRPSLLKDTADGWRYIMRFRGLFYLFLFGACTSLVVGVTQVVVTPMVLSFTTPAFLGGINTFAGLGIFLGGVLMAAWGGPKLKVTGVLLFGLTQGLALLLLGLRPEVVTIAAGVFCYLFSIQMAAGCDATIVRAYVPHTMQARVFSLRRFVAWSTLPVAYVAAGPLAGAFDPLLAPSGPLAGTFGTLLGTGPGRGIGLMIMLMGALFLLVVLVSFANPRLRHVEAELEAADPDTGDLKVSEVS